MEQSNPSWGYTTEASPLAMPGAITDAEVIAATSDFEAHLDFAARPKFRCPASRTQPATPGGYLTSSIAEAAT